MKAKCFTRIGKSRNDDCKFTDSGEEFIDRLAFSANWRWGLVIELIKKAILCCRKRAGEQLLIDDFSSVFAKRTGTSERFTPFNAADYERKFDPGRLDALIERQDR
jgi:hypothetical protein